MCPCLSHPQVQSLMILLISQPLGLRHRCCLGHLTCWTTSSACAMSCLCSSASVSSQVVSSLTYWSYQTLCFLSVSLSLCNLKDSPGIFLFVWTTGIPFMYRGLPCIYSSAILASASLLSGGNMAVLRVIAVAMILFMISHNFYPHDRILESQAWKKVVYAGGKYISVSLWQNHGCCEKLLSELIHVRTAFLHKI